MRVRPSWLGAIVVVCVLFLYAPLIVVVLYAFNGSSRLSWPLHGLSLRWFREILDDGQFTSAFRISAEAALATALASSVIATAAALAFMRRRNRFFALLQDISILPAMMPPLFIAIALFTAMSQFSIAPSLATIIVGHVVIVI